MRILTACSLLFASACDGGSPAGWPFEPTYEDLAEDLCTQRLADMADDEEAVGICVRATLESGLSKAALQCYRDGKDDAVCSSRETADAPPDEDKPGKHSVVLAQRARSAAAAVGGPGTPSAGRSGYGAGGGKSGGTGRMGADPVILGALDKSLIDAVIKRHMNQIRYCYERVLTSHPHLGGKIVVKFVIAKDGTVSKASTKSSTMNNKSFEGCLNSRFERFKFPEPKGGGIVIVSYPFIFQPG